MKTPMQEIYAHLKASKEKDSFGEVYCVDWLLENESKMLEKEKEVIMDALGGQSEQLCEVCNNDQVFEIEDKNKQQSNALYVLLCLVRLPLTFIIAIPCYFLVLPFWLLGIKNPWKKMTRLFDELAFNIQT